METIRTFIAIDLPEEVKQALGAIAQELRPIVPERAVRWVAPEKIHLTLRFLGNTPLPKVERIKVGLDELAAVQQPFSLSLDSLGCFPNERRPRVIWVGVEGETTRLLALKEAIDRMLAPLGWEPEARAFSAHLTLGRVKSEHENIRLPWKAPVVSQVFPVHTVHLFESQLRPTGALYTKRHAAHLTGEG